MRTYTFDLATVDAIAWLITVTRRDEVVKRMTSWPFAIIIGSETFTPAVGLKMFDIAERNDGTPATTQLEFAATADGPITLADIADKQYEAAVVEIDLCDANNPTAKDFHYYGRIGSVSKPLHGQVVFDLQNPHGFPRLNLVPQFAVMDSRFPFGGVMCGVPVMRPDIARSTTYAVGDTGRHNAGVTPVGYGNRYFEVTAITTGITAASAPTFDYTVGNTTTDDGVTWTARNAWERACTIASVINRHNMTLTTNADPRDVDGHFAPGKLMFTTGKNKNRVFKIFAWTQSSLQLTTALPAGLLTVPGDQAFIWPDCNKTLAMCRDKYANARRYGGFPYYEGAKAARQVI